MDNALVVAIVALIVSSGEMGAGAVVENQAFRLAAERAEGGIHMTLDDKAAGRPASDGAYVYRARRQGATEVATALEKPSVAVEGGKLIIRGKLAGLELQQSYSLPTDQPVMEERITLKNPADGEKVALEEFEVGFPLAVRDSSGKVRADLAGDRVAAVPFRHRADDGDGAVNEFTPQRLLDEPGWEYLSSSSRMSGPARHDSRLHFSEAWAWMHGQRSLGIFSFSQENLVYSVISPVESPHGKILRFGGACYLPIMKQPSAAQRIGPGQSMDWGLTRFESIAGGYNEVAYAYRRLLDSKGCRFPSGFDPPIHWEQLYDMRGAWNDRIHKYTKARIEQEAAKGVQYSCEALYLDPGWDTTFGSFLWADAWMGPRKQFIEEMQAKYGLKVSLHTPLVCWTSRIEADLGPTCVAEWPSAAKRQYEPPPQAKPAPATKENVLKRGPPPSTAHQENKHSPRLCDGSSAFLDEAEKRLLANCADGVVYLMFDGTIWAGPCNDKSHGHAVPYLSEDHIRKIIELVQRVHAKYPKVLIELHDTLAGGAAKRATPVYYKYGLPLSYDENWAFELMWHPMRDLETGRGLATYYYALACNVPLYLHIDLKADNVNCLELWWFASTVRHLGIGGTHRDPRVVEAQKAAMKTYRKWERFFKRGEFFGIDERMHLHVLKEENAFVVNMFDISNEPQRVAGQITLAKLGLDPHLEYVSSEPWAMVQNGVLKVASDMPAWSAKVAMVRAKK